MAPEREIIEVRVVGGRSKLAAVAFAPGVATQPFSVGTTAQWSVAGNGVGPVHLFVGFDGQRVLVVGAAHHLPVFVSGSRIGGSWVAVPLPGEVRFGEACLTIRRAPLSAAPENPAGFPTTVSDGGALWQAAQQAVQAAKASSPPGPPGDARGNLGGTMMIGAQPAPPTGQPAPLESLPPLKSLRRQKGATSRKPSALKTYWQSASPVKRITLALMPFSVAFGYWLFQPDERTAPKSHAAHAADSASHPSAKPPPASPPGAASGATTFTDRGDSGANHEAPLGQAPIAQAPAQTTPVASPISKPPTSPIPAADGSRTPERSALELVAHGYFDDAAREYDALASAHPNDPAFKEAARILRAKAGRAH